MLPDIIKNILSVGAGSFIGGTARYIISLAMKEVSKGFPWTMRRLHNILHILKRGVDHASGRTDMEFCKLYHNECPDRNCIGRTWISYSPLILNND